MKEYYTKVLKIPNSKVDYRVRLTDYDGKRGVDIRKFNSKTNYPIPHSGTYIAEEYWDALFEQIVAFHKEYRHKKNMENSIASYSFEDKKGIHLPARQIVDDYDPEDEEDAPIVKVKHPLKKERKKVDDAGRVPPGYEVFTSIKKKVGSGL